MSLTSQVEALNVSSHTRGEILKLDRCISPDQRALAFAKFNEVLQFFLLAKNDSHLLKSIYRRYLDLVLNPPTGFFADAYDTEVDQRTTELNDLLRQLPAHVSETFRHMLKRIDTKIPTELAIAQIADVLFEEGIEANVISEFFAGILTTD